MKCSPFLVIVAVSFACLADSKELKPANEGDPAYKVLFESGFYQEAIDYLQQKVRDPNAPHWLLHHQYLAFCLVLVDQADSAKNVFYAILHRDSTYQLSPITTSPDIYNMFVQAKTEWSAKPRTVPAMDTTSADDRNKSDTAATATMGKPASNQLSLGQPWFRVPLCLCPGGAGQFYQKHKIKGGVLLGIEAITMIIGAWAQKKRMDIYNRDNTGWTGLKIEQAKEYKDILRVQIALFSVTHVYGVVDAFWHYRKMKRSLH